MENKKAVKLTDFQKNEENPFMKQAIEGIENHVVKKYKSNSGGDKRAVVALADTETGEVFKTSFIRQIEVDEEQFTKLYLSNFAAFFDLSQAAIRVFGYFMTCMKPKNDLIIFNRKKCLEYTPKTAQNQSLKNHRSGSAQRQGAGPPVPTSATP